MLAVHVQHIYELLLLGVHLLIAPGKRRTRVSIVSLKQVSMMVA